MNSRTSLPRSALILTLSLCAPSLNAQFLSGTFQVTETWSATLTYSNWGDQNYSGTQNFNATQTGTIVVSAGQFEMLDQTGIPHDPPAGVSKTRRLNFDGNRYTISGDKVMPYILATVNFYGVLYLSEFMVRVPLVGGEIPVFDNYAAYGTSGSSLTALNGSGNMRGGSLTITVSSTSAWTPVSMPPIITAAPVSQTVNAGSPVSFTVSVVGSTPLIFQWQKDETNITGATGASYSISNVQPQHAGQYRAVVNNPFGTANSPPATLTVFSLPVITTQPQSQTVNSEGTAQFSVVAIGPGPLRYQWFFGDTNIAQATNSTLIIANVQSTDAGDYLVRVSNSYGTTSSLPATLTVKVQPATPRVIWMVRAGGASNDYGNGAATDDQGNIYMTGRFTGLANFGTNRVSGNLNQSSFFVAKYNNAGLPIWVRYSPGADYSEGLSIGVDGVGNSYSLVRISGATTFAGTNLVSSSSADYGIFKLDPEGNLLWVRQARGNAVATVLKAGVGVDSAGNCYVGTGFAGSVNLGETNLTSILFEDVLVAKYNSNGGLLWARQIASGASQAVAVDAAGNCYVTGIFSGPATINGNYYHPPGNTIFAAKYDSNGDIVWFRLGEINSLAFDGGTGVGVDQSGNCFVTGYIYGTTTFGTTKLTRDGAANVVLVKYSSAGEVLWAKRAVGATNRLDSWLAVDGRGDCYLTSPFTGSANLEGISVQSDADSDFYIARYSAAGEVLWVKQSRGGRVGSAVNVTVHRSGEAYLVGAFNRLGVFSFGGISFTNTGGPDIFFARLDTAFPFAPPYFATASLGSLTNGQFQIGLSSSNFASVIVQASTNLVNWEPISTNALPGGQIVLVQDPAAPAFQRRFYRALSIP